MTIGYLLAPPGYSTAIKKTGIRFFDGPDLLKKLDEERKAYVDETVKAISSLYRTSMLNDCQTLTRFVQERMYMLYYYRLPSGEDKIMKPLKAEQVIQLIKDLNYKSPF